MCSAHDVIAIHRGAPQGVIGMSHHVAAHSAGPATKLPRDRQYLHIRGNLKPAYARREGHYRVSPHGLQSALRAGACVVRVPEKDASGESNKGFGFLCSTSSRQVFLSGWGVAPCVRTTQLLLTPHSLLCQKAPAQPGWGPLQGRRQTHSRTPESSGW